MYTVLGAALSFGLGRTPGTLPEDLFAELALPALAVCYFAAAYSVYDVMAVGAIKIEKKAFDKSEEDCEEVRLAVRTQMNQVEQMGSFYVATLLFSLFVNGRVGGLLAFVWVLLRRCYANRYRASAGKSFMAKNLSTYTVPAYFILNALAVGTIVHVIRGLIASTVSFV